MSHLLFFDFTREVEKQKMTHRGSVLDALLDSAKSLKGRLGGSDRDKMDQYLTSVREVEKRLQMSKEWLDRPVQPFFRHL